MFIYHLLKFSASEEGLYSPYSTLSNGDEGTRTPDLLRAREALSQLSYIPSSDGPQWIRTIDLSLIRGML